MKFILIYSIPHVFGNINILRQINAQKIEKILKLSCQDFLLGRSLLVYCKNEVHLSLISSIYLYISLRYFNIIKLYDIYINISIYSWSTILAECEKQDDAHPRGER